MYMNSFLSAKVTQENLLCNVVTPNYGISIRQNVQLTKKRKTAEPKVVFRTFFMHTKTIYPVDHVSTNPFDFFFFYKNSFVSREG